MPMADERTANYLARMIRLETEKRENAEDRSELTKEMKGANLTAEEIAGIKLAVKRHFETAEKRQFRETVESVADALGDMASTPLGEAALRHVKNSPGVRRAMKQSERMSKEIRAAFDGIAAAEGAVAPALGV